MSLIHLRRTYAAQTACLLSRRKDRESCCGRRVRHSNHNIRHIRRLLRKTAERDRRDNLLNLIILTPLFVTLYKRTSEAFSRKSFCRMTAGSRQRPVILTCTSEMWSLTLMAVCISIQIKSMNISSRHMPAAAACSISFSAYSRLFHFPE